MRIAICPGSFDPVTVGHIDIIERASTMFDKVIASVMVNPEKTTAFTLNERIQLLRKAIDDKQINNVEVDGFDGLLAEYAREKQATVVVKGLRAVSDFEYEFQMALTNKKLNEDLETIFLTTSSQYMFLSSSLVRQVAKFNGDITQFVPNCVLEEIEKRLKKETI